MSKVTHFIKQMCHSMILAGVIVLCVGVYYLIIKAGIPYQDPDLKLQIQYSIHMGIGQELMKDGCVIVLVGIVARIILLLIAKWRDKRHEEN